LKSFEKHYLLPLILVAVVAGFLYTYVMEEGEQQAVKESPEQVAEQISQHADSKIALKVLYVGQKGTPRLEEFHKFLSSHFATVGTGDYHQYVTQFDIQQANAYDVVIFDYDNPDYEAMKFEVLDGYSKATMTVGVSGALWCNNHGLKCGYT